jgi:PII interaction protein X
MSAEDYLNHPTFGLLSRLCVIEEKRELFSTIYAQRLFFLVETSNGRIQFEPIGRNDARILLENRLRNLRRIGDPQEYEKLKQVHQQTF